MMDKTIINGDTAIHSWTEDGIESQYCVRLTPKIGETPVELLIDGKIARGQFSFLKKIDDSTYDAIRDPLGIGKLFYVETKDGNLIFSEKFASLFPYKASIFSVPAGMHVRIGSSGKREMIKTIGPEEHPPRPYTTSGFENVNTNSLEMRFREKMKRRLQCAFSLVGKLENDGWKVFVALSGGLDSSIIAAAAAEYLAEPVACTLDLGKSEDAEKGKRIAEIIGIDHLSFETNESEILEALAEAPILCQDFRDFNVHCAALNMLLAKNIRKWVDQNHTQNTDKVIILTGDLMNEFTCDYAGEVIDGVEYYKLPNIGKKELQTYLIRGLDTSDREILPFSHYGISCIQPYAILFDLFLGLGEDVFKHNNPKKLLNSFMVNKKVLELIPKTKLRAQVGSRDSMGILGLCHRMGMNNKHFMKILLDRFDADEGSIPIFVGKYDVEKFS